MNRVDFRLYVITDRRKTRGRPLEKVIEDSIKGGATAFQLREKDIPSGELFGLAQRIKAITRKNGCRLIVNDRADIVEAADAEGLHLPKNGMPVRVARKLIGEEKLLAPVRGRLHHRIDGLAGGMAQRFRESFWGFRRTATKRREKPSREAPILLPSAPCFTRLPRRDTGLLSG